MVLRAKMFSIAYLKFKALALRQVTSVTAINTYTVPLIIQRFANELFSPVLCVHAFSMQRVAHISVVREKSCTT
jgi:hypothetical protein